MDDAHNPLPADDPARALIVALAGDAALRHISLAGGAYTILVSGADTGGRYTLIDMVVPPDGGPPPHRHDFEEAFVLLDGELDFTFRGERRTVAAPATIAVPSNAPHAFRNASGRPARMLCLCTPAGQEEFFAAVGVAVPGPESPPPVLSEAELAERRALAQALAPRFRTEFLAR